MSLTLNELEVTWEVRKEQEPSTAAARPLAGAGGVAWGRRRWLLTLCGSVHLTLSRPLGWELRALICGREHRGMESVSSLPDGREPGSDHGRAVP